VRQTVTADWPTSIFGEDWRLAILLGRADFGEGPTPFLVLDGRAFDISRLAPTVSQAVGVLPDVLSRARRGEARDLGPLGAAIAPSQLLAPIDLQCVKAAGVTFALSAVERVIEERARGDFAKANHIRQDLQQRIGTDISAVKPGSAEAARLKAALIADGLWSQYLEVAIGPDAEVFTKAPVLSSVGWGAEIGVRSDSDWNNPEPEVVLVCDANGHPVGATLGNDVNLRDFEGRSALLLGKAKDNNASCAIGPFLRLFDADFTLDMVRQAQVSLEIEGLDGYRLSGLSSMAQISRDPLELIRQTLSEHQYPDGFALFLGTLFAPTQDRDLPGQGFTHKVGDRVRVSSPGLGVLENTVVTSKSAAPWRFGIASLMTNLASRGLLRGAPVQAALLSVG
jgi:fumarylacetoacetate (FAA) hydrolase family protein